MTLRNRVLTGTSDSGIYENISKPRPTGAAFCVPAYDWRADALNSYAYALHMKALAIGAKRPSTVAELYFCESHGVIP